MRNNGETSVDGGKSKSGGSAGARPNGSVPARNKQEIPAQENVEKAPKSNSNDNKVAKKEPTRGRSPRKLLQLRMRKGRKMVVIQSRRNQISQLMEKVKFRLQLQG